MTDRFDDGPTDPNLALDPDQRQELHREVTGDALVAAIYANPDDDEPRLVYGDYLIEHDDPRGEFIQLQLARPRGAPPSDRERELLAQHLGQWTMELGPALQSRSIVFERGFLASCDVRDNTIELRDVIGHPMWLTVEELASNEIALVTNTCMRSLRSLHGKVETLAALAGVAHPVRLTRAFVRGYGPFDALNRTSASAWRQVFEVGALKALRSFDLSLVIEPRDPMLHQLLASKLGRQLVELRVMLTGSPIEPWLHILREYPSLQRIAMRPGEAYAPQRLSTVVVALERDERNDIQIIVELDDHMPIGGILATLLQLPEHGTIQLASVDPNLPLSDRRFEELVSSLAPRAVVRR